MDIFTPAPIDRETVITIEANKLIQFNREMIENLIVNHTAAFNMVWHNPNCTAQEIFDMFGANAYKLFVSSGDMQALIKKIKPDYEPLVPPVEYVINQDGTVTVI